MSESNDELEGLVLKTHLTPEELARECFGGQIEWTAENNATKRHIVTVPRQEVDAIYRERLAELDGLSDAVMEHVRTGGISPAAERAVAGWMQWALDQLELMRSEQKLLVRWLMEASSEVERFRIASAGARGGSAAAAITREVRNEAVRLATEKAPEGGWLSAPQAAEAIMADVAAYAKARGRNPARRKVEEWLRAAGIKRRKHAQ